MRAATCVQLVSGKAEVFGSEMVLLRAYSFTNTQQARRAEHVASRAGSARAAARLSQSRCDHTSAGCLQLARLHPRDWRAVRPFLREQRCFLPTVDSTEYSLEDTLGRAERTPR